MNLARNPLRSLSPPHDRAILPQLQEDGAGARPAVESNKRSRGSFGQKVRSPQQRASIEQDADAER